MIESIINKIREEQAKQLEKIMQYTDGQCKNNSCENHSENSSDDASNNNINQKKVFAKTAFKLPIEYLENKQEISKNVFDDLELIESKDASNNSLYEHVFKPKSIFGEKYVHIWSKYYTADVGFLKETQEFLSSYVGLKNNENDNPNENPCELYEKIKTTWESMIYDAEFRDKYNYIDFPMFDNLNHSAIFLQLLSMYNLFSPVISLLTPLLLAIIPFFILKYQKIQISFENYFTSLKRIIVNHPIGKIFTLSELKDVPWDKRIYVIMTIVFYFIQIYQNIVSCYRFYKNMFIIHSNIFQLRDYFKHTIENIDRILSYTTRLNTYNEFNKDLIKRKHILEELYYKLANINPFKLSFSKLCNIGSIMKLNYQLFVDESLKECVDYSFGFNAYVKYIENFKTLIDNNIVNKCTFTVDIPDIPEDRSESTDSEKCTDNEKSSKNSSRSSSSSIKSSASTLSKKSSSSTLSYESNNESNNELNNESNKKVKKHNKKDKKDKKYKKDKSKLIKSMFDKTTKFIDVYYPPLMDDNPVKNNVTLNKNIIITGPNASGKTTIIKSVLFNIILCQQTGFGFFTSAVLTPYDYVYSYLNIPDTSGRDSLFQAESRRCKEILDSLISKKEKTHFCIFDELYSGTNPYEAVASAYGYIDYLSSLENVKLMLTTHYVELCDKLNDNKCINNLHMAININENDDVTYLYRLEDGISHVKGGIKVLCDLEYPDSIIENTKKALHP